MAHKSAEQRKGPNLKDLWKLVLAGLGVAAVIQELRKPADERTWHGKVAGFVPYDFRKPSFERIREAYWNPDGPIVSSRAFGVGWVMNFGAVTKLVSGYRSSGGSSSVAD